MSVCTKGCIVTDNKNAFFFKDVFESWWKNVLEWKNISGWYEMRERGFSTFPTIELAYSCHAMKIFFKYENEDRQMFVTFDCDCDLQNYPEIEGEKCIWISLGHWGKSEEILQSILEEFKKSSEVSNVYIDRNDCDDVEFEQF
jgi:hypothetical protein